MKLCACACECVCMLTCFRDIRAENIYHTLKILSHNVSASLPKESNNIIN